MQHRAHVAYVDGLRAVAVLSVLAFFAIGGAARATGAAACLAHGLDLFFVISGLCLALPALSRWRAGRGFRLDRAIFSRFLLRRFSRIAPPFYLALAFFAVLGMTGFGFPGLQNPDPGLAFSPQTAREFLGDLAFLTPRVPIHNAAFWTLGIEARWYLVCPLLIALYVRSRWAFAALAAALYAAYFLVPGAVTDVGTLPCFMAGIVAADAIVVRSPWKRYAWIGALLTVGAGLILSNVDPGDHGNPLWHAAAFFLIVACSRPLFRRMLTWPPMLGAGIASYSIYLYDVPFVQWFEAHGVIAPLAAAWALCIGFAAWALLERHLSSDGFRRALEHRLGSLLGTRPRPERAQAEPA
jgi:peptidoglycan/LPS O-acetylase OafA/YrhL